MKKIPSFIVLPKDSFVAHSVCVCVCVCEKKREREIKGWLVGNVFIWKYLLRCAISFSRGSTMCLCASLCLFSPLFHVKLSYLRGCVKDRTVTPRSFRDVATGIGGVGEIQCRRWSFDIKIYIFIYRGTVNPNTVHTT